MKLCGSNFADKNKISKKRVVSSAPSILTSLGVLGTFVGIFWGLFLFDVQNIDNSIPELLNGLKTAFFSSVLGLFFSILFRFLQQTFLQEKIIAEESDNPIEVLLALKNSVDRQTSAIVGEEDQSLLSQIKSFRTDVSDSGKKSIDVATAGFTQQITAFKEFAKQMAENNSKALIEALENVISDFNKNLTEQFGENFKHLNQAVGALLVWQENYKTHIERLEAQSELSLNSLKSTEGSISVIADKAQKIPETMASLEQTVATAGIAIGAVGGLLATVASMGDKAEGAFPKIESNIEMLTTNLERSAKEQAKSLTNAADELAINISESIEKTQNGINKNFETFDEQMQTEIQRALQLLGSQLGSISSKMTEDYSKFADSASKFVRLAANS